ncbi:MAG: PEP-CTERM sorting domain-containing protein [Phycisphaeraceae bacterium]
MRFVLSTLATSLFVSSASAVPISWVDWTSGTAGPNGSAVGTLNVDGEIVDVTYTGEIQFIQTAGGTNYWNPDAYSTTTPVIDNPPPASDIIALSRATSKTLTFSRPIANPIFSVVSLNGNGYSFDRDFDILGFGRGFWGNGTLTKTNPAPGVYQLNGSGEPHGSIQFTGAFTTVSWTSLSNENWNGFTIGVTGVADPILTTTPGDGGSLDFLARAGTSDNQSLNAGNAGIVGTTLTGLAGSPAGGAPFSGPLEAPAISLDGGQTTDFTYTFSPTTRGAVSGSVDIQSNEDGIHQINLAGVGVGPVLGSSISPGTTLDLGAIAELANLDEILSVSNTTPDNNGGVPELTDMTLDFSIGGVDAGLFEVDLVGGEVIGKGSSLDIMVTFLGSLAPGEGTYEAELTLFTDEGVALGQTNAGEVYSFNLTAVVIPEPASLALLGLGGLALIRRK